MTDYKRYDEYKSGADWLGEIPSDWEMKKLKSIATINPSNKNKNLLPDTEVAFLPMEALSTKNSYESISRPLSEVSSGYSHFSEGDVVLAKVTPCFENHKAAVIRSIPNGIGYGTTEIHTIRPDMNQVLVDFLYYLISITQFKEQGVANLKGIGGLKRVSSEFLGSFKFPLPPLGTQHSIVEFLDAETAHIDSGIANMESLIALLTEKRTALIAEAVTRGIPGEHTEFKASGVEWLGEIPIGWEIKKIGSLFKNRSEKVSDKDFPALSVTKKGIVPQLSNAAKTDDGDNRKKILKGDFVINSRSDRKGSSGVSDLDGSTSLISTVLVPNGELISGYIHNLLRSPEFQEEYYRFGKGIVADLWTTRFHEMKSISLPVPPIGEQEMIVQYLGKAVKDIDAILETANLAKKLFKEKRQTLISDVVTGKIDVTNSTN